MSAIPTTSGGRITTAGLIWAGAGEWDRARKEQLRLQEWESVVQVDKRHKAVRVMGPFTRGGHVVVAAKKPEEYGSSGHIFPLVPAVITEYGTEALSHGDTADSRLLSIDTSKLTPLGATPPTIGQRGIVVRGSRPGDLDNLYWLTPDASLISHWAGPGANARSTRVYDIGADGKPDPERNGPVDFLTVVTLSPVRAEQVPVLNGAADPAPVGGPILTPAGLVTGTSNSGGGTSSTHDPLTIERIRVTGLARIIPIADGGGPPAGGDPTTGSRDASGAGSWRGGSGRLRYIETGPTGAVHVAQVSAGWLVDGDTCEEHRYATSLVVTRDAAGRAGAILPTYECSLHYPVGPREGMHFKLRGNAIKDGPLKFDTAEWKAVSGAGQMTEVYIRHHSKDFHVHRGRKLKGLWKLEVPVPLAKTTTPGLGGGPVDPVVCLQPIQMAGYVPTPLTSCFGESSAVDFSQHCAPLDASVWDSPDRKNRESAPNIGMDTAWAKQGEDGGWRATRRPNFAVGARLADGGVLRLPADITPTCVGSASKYEPEITDGWTPVNRTDIAHYRVSDGYGRPSPTRATVVDGFLRSMTGSAGVRTLVFAGVDSSGVAGATGSGLYRVKTRALPNCGGVVTRVLESDAFTPGSGLDHDLIPETGVADNLQTIDATNAEIGDEVRVRAAIGTITILETGNILVAGGTSLAITGFTTVTFRWDGGKWVETARAAH